MIRVHHLIFILPIMLLACKQSEPIKQELALVWWDEFDGDELDETKWHFQLGDGADYGLWQWGNNEAQYYKRENVFVEDGLLKIKAVKESFAGYEYTSARIRSLGSGDFKYGRIEASIRMDDTDGLWHAFWLLPSNPKESWPISGEIDIMEYVGNNPTQILNYVHFADNQGNHSSRGDGSTVQNISSDFIKYAIEWSEEQITWFINDEQTYRILRTDNDIAETWPFDAEFHILLNTAIGGNLGGAIDAEALETPKYMEVQYVRVYQ